MVITNLTMHDTHLRWFNMGLYNIKTSNEPQAPDSLTNVENEIPRTSDLTSQKIAEQLEQMLRQTLEQKRDIGKTNNLVLFGFFFALLTAAGLLSSNIIAQLQAANDANTLTNNSLQTINNDVKELQYQIKSLNSTEDNK